MPRFLLRSRLKRPDPVLVTLLTILVAGGFFIFLSASLGLLARGTVSFTSIAFNQFFLGIVLGSVGAVVMSRIHYKKLREFAPAIFALSLLGACAVFIPGIGMEWAGATRWIHVGPVTFQPAELVKIGAILFAAHMAARYARELPVHPWRGFVLLMATVGAVALPLLLQPDTDTFLVIAVSVAAIYFAAGLQWRDIGIMTLMLVVGVAVLAMVRPYVLERMTTFINPAADARGSGYQIQQSLIAIGSGGMWGRGFGQSVQKFNYLPEPVGDSIFAVYAEEFGFVGSVALLLLILGVIFRLLYLSTRAPDMFGALLLVGMSATIGIQSFLNIGAMLGVVPLAGLPLTFVSHGGTAMAASLLSVGVALNVSRYRV